MAKFLMLRGSDGTNIFLNVDKVTRVEENCCGRSKYITVYVENGALGSEYPSNKIELGLPFGALTSMIYEL